MKYKTFCMGAVNIPWPLLDTVTLSTQCHRVEELSVKSGKICACTWWLCIWAWIWWSAEKDHMKCSPLQQRPPSSPPPLQYKDLGQHEAGTHYHGPIVNFLNPGMRYFEMLSLKVKAPWLSGAVQEVQWLGLPSPWTNNCFYTCVSFLEHFKNDLKQLSSPGLLSRCYIV